MSDGVAMRAALRNALDRGLDAHWLVPVVLGNKKTGKRPAHDYIERDVHAPADEEWLWGLHRPRYGLGMRTARNGICVVEVDWPQEAAERERVRAELIRLLAPDSRTLPPPAVRSGGGGEHWHIRFHEGVPPSKGCVLWQGAGEHEEIRLLGAHGNAVLPPTLHHSGNEYAWAGGSTLDATPALLEAVAAHARADPTDDGAELEPEPLDLAALPKRLRKQLEEAGAKEDRSVGIFRAVALLQEHGKSPGQALWLVTESDLPFCSKAAALGPDWAATEVLRIWGKRAMKRDDEAATDFAQQPAARNERGRFVLTKASDLMDEELERIYRTALGAACPVGVVMIAGLGGTGKSTIAATLAASVSNGTPCPPWEAKASKRARAGVLWLSTEESRDGMVLPRHQALGGDMDLLFVHTIAKELDEDTARKAVSFDLEDDLEPLLEQAQAAGTPIRLVVCDTLPALVNWEGRSPNSDTEVKQLMENLSTLAFKHDCCILGISHLNKKADMNDEYRMAGAQAWRESPRLSFLCKAGYIYVNKANDIPEVGCGYEQEEVKELYKIAVEFEGGGPLTVSARRAKFGPVLMRKPKVLELVEMAAAAAKQEQQDEKPKRIDKMVEIATELFDLLGDRVNAGSLWRALAREYGKEPTGTEKKTISLRLGLHHKQEGTQHFLERRPA